MFLDAIIDILMQWTREINVEVWQVAYLFIHSFSQSVIPSDIYQAPTIMPVLC